jgi:transcriptional regulator with XRE-family HTH domain
MDSKDRNPGAGGAGASEKHVQTKNDSEANSKPVVAQALSGKFSANSAATRMLLADALRTAAPTSAALAVFADRAGVGRRQACLARAGKPICAGAYLALCGALGISPMDGTRRAPKIVSPNVEWWLVGTALYITRGLRRLNQRQAAKAIGVSPSTVCRLEACKPVSIANLVKVCRFIGVHADGYTAPHAAGVCGNVPRETTTETRCPSGEIRDVAAEPAPGVVASGGAR